MNFYRARMIEHLRDEHIGHGCVILTWSRTIKRDRDDPVCQQELYSVQVAVSAAGSCQHVGNHL